MAFKTVFVAHTPDADPQKHKEVIETGMYKLFIVLVRNQEQTVKECRKLMEEEGIHSILLCPGYTHKNVAELFEIFNGEVGVSVARGDGPSSRIAKEVMEKEGWFN